MSETPITFTGLLTNKDSNRLWQLTRRDGLMILVRTRSAFMYSYVCENPQDAAVRDATELAIEQRYEALRGEIYGLSMRYLPGRLTCADIVEKKR
jgi:hypothetical protein